MNPHGVPKHEMNVWYAATTGKTSRSVRWMEVKKSSSLSFVIPAWSVMAPPGVSRSRTSV